MLRDVVGQDVDSWCVIERRRKKRKKKKKRVIEVAYQRKYVHTNGVIETK